MNFAFHRETLGRLSQGYYLPDILLKASEDCFPPSDPHAISAGASERRDGMIPICIKCGSDKIVRPGFISYHYRRGQWVSQRGSEELADTECVSCQKCGTSMTGDESPPFNYIAAKTR
jgi:hypothetical protein